MSRYRYSFKTDPNPQKKPTVAIVRFGAYGDTIQSASVCASFRKLGYHVTMLCSHPASEVVAFDPNIDRLITVMQNQVPVNWLGLFWAWLREKDHGKGFDRWVNLTNSIEGHLLATEGDIRFEWPPLARHVLMNRNYLEAQHLLAGVPYEPSFKFHPHADELKWASIERARMEKAGISKFILWGLAGSSRGHKIWPWIDEIFARVIRHYPEWGIVTVGDGSCADLEKGWEGEPRIWRTCGKWTMRQVLTMMEVSDAVVGPETGLLSAAAFYSVPKIVFLSHSTVENLTRDWINTTSLWAPSTVCPGRGANEVPACHKMLPSFNGCRQHESGVAQCAAEIKPEWVWDVIQKIMNEGSGGTWFPPVEKLAIQSKGEEA